MKLSEFTGDKSLDIAAQAMPLIMQIRYNAETTKAWENIVKDAQKKKKNGEKEDKRQAASQIYKYFSTMLINEREAAIELFALLNDLDVEEYKAKATAATVLNDIFNAFAFDNELMTLFGLRTQKDAPSSGSATESIEE